LDINAVDNRLESAGGSANIQIDPNQTLQLGGAFNPAYVDPMTGARTPQSYSIHGTYKTPGIGVNVNYRNTGGRTNSIPGAGAGFPGEFRAGFQGRF
jgi:hypothetical protein